MPEVIELCVKMDKKMVMLSIYEKQIKELKPKIAEKERISCRNCGSFSVMRKGARKITNGKRNIYFCKNCSKRFSLGLSKKKFDVFSIINAVCAYNQGYSYGDACELVGRKNKIKVSKSSVERWVKEYNLGYLGIRDKIISKYGKELIIERVFNHSGVAYNFKTHKGKLKEFGKFSGLKDFIFDICRGVNDNFFNGQRCSDSRENISVNIVAFENTKLNKVIGEMLKIVRNNKQRHMLVENLMLNCDRDTVAVEVPVWYWDKKKNIGICGHIDIIQVKFGKIWIMDYKPDAEKEKFNEVVSQLYHYAVALSFRTGVGISNIKCGWFDDCKMFSFNPEKARVKHMEIMEHEE